MKRLFITLGLTLLIVMAYLGSAHAQPVAAQPAGQAAQTVPTGEAKKKYNFEDKLEGGKTVKSEVTETQNGDFYIDASVAGCTEGCTRVQQKLDKTRAQLSDNKSVDQQIAEFKDLILSKFGKVAAKEPEKTAAEKREEEREAKREERERKEGIKACKIDKDDFHTFSPDEVVTCMSDKVDEAFKKGRIEEAKNWLDKIAAQATQDFVDGVSNSPFIAYMKSNMDSVPSAGETADIAKYNAAHAFMAVATEKVYSQQTKKENDLRISAKNYARLAENTSDSTMRERYTQISRNQASQAEAIKQTLPALRTNADAQYTKFDNLKVTTQGFSKSELKARYEEKAGVKIGGAGELMLSSGNSASDEVSNRNNSRVRGGNYAINFNDNLSKLDKEIKGSLDTKDSCRTFGNAFGSCGGTPDNVPNTPAFNAQVKNPNPGNVTSGNNNGRSTYGANGSR